MNTKTKITLLAATAILATATLAVMTNFASATEHHSQSPARTPPAVTTPEEYAFTTPDGSNDLRTFLSRSYARYIFVQYCHQVREGYLYTFINDSEAGWAKRAIESIQHRAKELNSTLDTDKLWNIAWDTVRTMHADRDTCQFQLQKLVNQSGINVFKIDQPR